MTQGRLEAFSDGVIAILVTIMVLELKAAAVGKDRKGKISGALFFVAIIVAFWRPQVATALYITVAAIWFIPDWGIERQMEHRLGSDSPPAEG